MWKNIVENQSPKILFFVLLILEYFYEKIIRLRNIFYDEGIGIKKVPAVVISVGNITLGGTGKTPFVIFLAEFLKKEVIPCAILSRGYKGKRDENKNYVSNGKRIFLSVKEAGDEPRMMAEILTDIPVLVGADRVEIAQMAIEDKKVRALILDDGYQHRRLHRDLNILIVDATNPFGNGHVFPAGILREPICEIKRADIIILSKTNFSTQTLAIQTEILKYNPQVKIFESTFEPVCFYSAIKGDKFPLSFLSGKKVLLVSSIGNPQIFKKQVEALGAEVVDKLFYNDHHEFSLKDFKKIEKLFAFRKADFILVTHKDVVKMENFNPSLPLIFIYSELRIKHSQEENFAGILKRIMMRRQTFV